MVVDIKAIDKRIGEKLRTLRQQLILTHEDFVEFFIIKPSAEELMLMEEGEMPVPAGDLFSILRELNIDMDFFFKNEVNVAASLTSAPVEISSLCVQD